jgi:superfamily II DNA or RNA helicase
MPTPRQLRPYQREAADAVYHAWGSDTRRTAVVLPTGTGKSSVIATVAAESARRGLRVAMLAHRGELLDQMADTVPTVDPDLPRPGIVRAEHDQSDAQIIAASFQTLTNGARLDGVGARRVILVDEVHHVSASSYRKVVESFGPETFFCGFTATLRREDGKALREMIDSVAYEKNLRWAIDEGYLVRPSGLTIRIPDLDLSKVRTTAGDFQNSDLAEVMEAETDEVVKAILKHCADRRPIVFAASVQACHDIADMLTQHGMTAEAVTGQMGYDDRHPIYDRYRSGQTRALVTVMVLTEGADFPMCDAVVIARPTQSQNLYSQMVGRALRLYPDKSDALVVDLVGTARVLKLVTLSNLEAGVPTRQVDPDGNEIEPEPEDEAVEEPAGPDRYGPHRPAGRRGNLHAVARVGQGCPLHDSAGVRIRGVPVGRPGRSLPRGFHGGEGPERRGVDHRGPQTDRDCQGNRRRLRT